jgi:CRISPR/Cas system-associated exonuclease Cas4 (RecB family)
MAFYRKKLYDPNAKEAFRISRSKIDLFIECPRCFYLDRRLGVSRPPGFPFSLNNAVDILLKKEFDIHRKQGTSHPLMESYGVEAVPFQDKRMEIWRDTFKGVEFFHEPTNFVVFGGIDDAWIDKDKKIIVVDYKATSKTEEVTLDAEWQDGYKRQMEVYQWLLRHNDLDVSDTGYFVYANGKRDRDAFDGKLEFDIKLIAYTGSDKWVEKTLLDMKKYLDFDDIPKSNPNCEYCSYINSVNNAAK